MNGGIIAGSTGTANADGAGGQWGTDGIPQAGLAWVMTTVM